MATQILKTVFQLRRAHTDEWLQYKDVVPAEGEPCFDIDLNTLKIGNGKDSYEKLEPVGTAKVAADGKSIILEDGIFKLMGFDAAEVGTQPRKKADGTIEWVVPSTETVDGLQKIVTGLQSDVTGLQTTVTTIREIVMPSGEGEGTLLERVTSLEGKMDGTGEGTVDAKIDAKINEFANKVSDDKIVNTLKELIDYVAEHGPETAAMAADIKTLQGLVGTTVIKEVTVNGTLMDVVEGRVNIAVPEFKGSDEIDVSEDGTLSIKTISIDKIAQDDETVIVMDGGGAV